jgi:hypothetical protein
MQWHSQFLGGVGQAQAALEAAIRAKELDPLSPVINQRLAIARLWASDNEAAKELFGLAAELGMPETTNPEPYMILLLRMGEYETARSLMAGMQAMLGFGNDWIDPVFAAIRDQDLRAEAVAAVIEAEQKGQIAMRYLFGAWLYLDETDRAIDIALSLVKDRPSFSPEILFIEEAGRLRSNPRFAELVRAIGLDRYWDNFGWPELCKRVEEEIVCS